MKKYNSVINNYINYFILFILMNETELITNIVQF